MAAKFNRGKYAAWLVLTIIIFLVIPLVFTEHRWAIAAWISPVVEAPGKDDVGVNDEDDVNRRIQKANVLFFLDTSHPMMLEPRGSMPYVVMGNNERINSAATEAAFGYNEATALDMMKYVTFGVGTVPPSDSYYKAPVVNFNNYGRDTDDKNNLKPGNVNLNDPDNMYKYYSPYNQSGHTLKDTFTNQSDLYYANANNSGGGWANNVAMPDSYKHSYDYKAAVDGGEALPYMLVFKDPKYWKTPPANFTVDDLVPNDSRMYQMKLVMWKLMEDRILFENIRFGMSTVFTAAQTAEDSLSANAPNQNATRGEVMHAVYKISPYSRTDYFTNGLYYALNDITNTVVSVPPNPGLQPGYHYWYEYGDYGSQSGTWGVYSTGFVDFQRRAWLRVPIADYDKEWTTKGGTVKMTQLERFRIWLDGVEDIAGQYYNGSDSAVLENDLHANQFDIHRNPELKVSSPVPLSQTIFPKPNGIARGSRSRSWYLSHGGVSYAKADSIFAYKNNESDFIVENGWQSNGERYTHYFKPGSGEAMGSVLDFFSPNKSTFDSGEGASFPGTNEHEKFSDMIDEQFPIRNTCDPNYVILFTAGDNSPADYPLAEAVGNLYTYTKNNAVTILGYDDNKNRVFTEAKLEKPIKTIVVGFVDPNDMTPNVVTMRDNLTAMAKAGDPDNPNAKAYFANDVPGLLTALREVMVIINNDIQPAKGSMLEGDQLSGDDLEGLDLDADIMNLYAASYRIKIFDQWEGTLTKYITAKNKATGEMETKEDGELGKRILSRRDSNAGNPRNLKFWNGGDGSSFADVGFTGSNTVNTAPHPLAELTGLDFDVSETTELDATFMSDNTFVGKTHPSRAMFDWYYGYDVSYIYQRHYPRDFMLVDQGNSGIVKAGVPGVVNSLPGFAGFADSRKDDPVRLYVQTNDGVLHVVDPKQNEDGTGMREELAILPPPTLLPRRVFSLKTTKQDGKYRWIDADEYLTDNEDDIPISSVPAYILDGPLQLRYFDLGNQVSGNNWRGLLFGSLGRGGSGLYVMDVTKPDDPEFSWYRETIEDDDVNLRLIWRAADTPAPAGAVHPAAPNVEEITRDDAYWTDLYDRPNDHPYEQLGFNPPKPYFSVAELGSNSPPTYQNLVALAGGMQNRLELDNNGTMGAALYLADPDKIFHGQRNPGGVKVYNSGSLRSVSDGWRVGSEERGGDPYMGMVNSEPVFLATRQSSYVARGTFFSDNRGSVFYIAFVDSEGVPYESWNDWQIYTVASLHTSGDDPTVSYSIPWGLMGGSRGGSSRLWVGGGTANAALADPPDDDIQHLVNKSQMIFAFVMPDIADDAAKMSVRDDWAELDAQNNDVPDADEAKLKNGWYIPLEKGNEQYHDEYVTMRPVLFGGNLYVATFMEEKIDLGSLEVCETSRFLGKSRLYAISLEDGKPVLWGGGDTKYLEFDGIKFISFTLSEKGDTTTGVVAYRVLDQTKAGSDINKNTSNEGALSALKGLEALVIKMKEGGGGNSNVVSNDSVLNYWLYN